MFTRELHDRRYTVHGISLLKRTATNSLNRTKFIVQQKNALITFNKQTLILFNEKQIARSKIETFYTHLVDPLLNEIQNSTYQVERVQGTSTEIERKSD